MGDSRPDSDPTNVVDVEILFAWLVLDDGPLVERVLSDRDAMTSTFAEEIAGRMKQSRDYP